MGEVSRSRNAAPTGTIGPDWGNASSLDDGGRGRFKYHRHIYPCGDPLYHQVSLVSSAGPVHIVFSRQAPGLDFNISTSPDGFDICPGSFLS